MDRELAIDGGSYAWALEGENRNAPPPLGCFLGVWWF